MRSAILHGEERLLRRICLLHIYWYGLVAERGSVRILGVALFALSTFDAVPGFISVIGRERSRHLGASLCHGLLCRLPALHIRL